jgi:5-methylcytosine-specific restriction endonuclease McrA
MSKKKISITKKRKAKTRVKRVEALRLKSSTSASNRTKSVSRVVEDRLLKPERKRAFIIQRLRRASLAWPPKNIARKRSWIKPGWHKCEGCGAITHYKDLQMDHIIPAVNPETGWVSYDDFIEKLFCGSEGYQGLCPKCHSKKTEEENKIRRTKKKPVDKKK